MRRLVLGGLPLLPRVALAARRAGFGPVLVARTTAEDEAMLARISGHSPVAESAAITGRRRVVLLADGIVPQPAWLRHLAAMPVEPDHLYLDGQVAAVVDATDAAGVLALAMGGDGVAGVFGQLRRTLKAVDGPLAPGGRFPLADPGEAAAAEAWLLRSLIKPGEHFISRHVERRLSLALTRRLARTAITPNAVSAIMVAIGLAGAPFFLSASAGWQLVGAVLFLAHSILDGCDGELARLKFMESPAGATLDFWGDNTVHSAVFGCMAVGWSLGAGSAWPLLLGAIVVGSTLLAAATLHGDPGPAATAPASVQRRIVDSFSNRSFIYLIGALAALGHAWWFLVPAALGTPVFVALALSARGRGRAA